MCFSYIASSVIASKFSELQHFEEVFDDFAREQLSASSPQTTKLR
jgi:hypothetical protein